jgi:endonuclease/exonuclease/phosphatase family metal-dependent hydrolase
MYFWGAGHMLLCTHRKGLVLSIIALLAFGYGLFGASCCAGAGVPVASDGGLVGSKRITVMTYNIHYGVGFDFVYDLDRIADLIEEEGADIIGLCEVEQCTKKFNYQDQAGHIADKLGFYYAYGPIFARKDGGYFSNALISRYPIVSHQTHQLPIFNDNQKRAVLEAQVDVDGTLLNVFVTHLEVKDHESRMAQAQALLEIASRTECPRIIMGDFNTIPTSSVIALMLHEYNDTYQVYRVLTDSAEIASEGLFERDYLKGGYTIDPFDPNRRIDFIFSSFDIRVVGEPKAARVRYSMASDHLPYIATLELPAASL